METCGLTCTGYAAPLKTAQPLKFLGENTNISTTYQWPSTKFFIII